MQGVEVDPVARAFAHRFHRRKVALAPGVGKGCAVDAQAQRLNFTRDRAAPVDDGTEDIKGQQLNITKGIHDGQIRSEPDVTGERTGDKSGKK